MPFRFDPDTYYTKPDIKAFCDSVGIDVDTFLSRLNPRKVFKGLYKGSDLNAAYDGALPLEDGRKVVQPVDLPETRKRKSKPAGKTYGGFSAEVIGLERAS